MKSAVAAAFLAAVPFAALSCGSPALAQKPKAAPAPVAAIPAESWITPNPDDLLVVDTNKGRIVAELSPLAAPATVERVKTLARQHFYDGLTFFRVIEGFMDQTGDPKNTGEGGSDLPDLKAEFTFRRGPDAPFVAVASPTGGASGFIGVLPVYSQPDGLMAMTADGKVTAWGAYCPGVLGMARENTPDSANSQFFFMRDTYPALEKRYTAFGRVLSGQDAVRGIKVGEPVEQPQDRMVKVRLASDMPPADRPKIQRLDPASAAFKAQIDKARAERGADLSVCDLTPAVRGG